MGRGPAPGCVPKCPGLCGPWKVFSILLWLQSGQGDPLCGGGENRSQTRPGCGQPGVDAGVSGPGDGCTLISFWLCAWEGTAVTLCPCHMWVRIQL